MALHVANTLLLFLVLRRLTGAKWRNVLAAAFFGLHPLHVESVAWVSERKDVLAGWFFLLTLGAYTIYVRTAGAEPGAAGSAAQASGSDSLSPPLGARPLCSIMLALIFFALGLMSKPMLVTVPFVLLLLDYWPLQR